MKHGLFIYQVPPMLGRNVMVDNYAFMNLSFMGIGKEKKFLEKLQAELVTLNYPVTVVKDELPQIFHIDSEDYYSSLISKIMTKIEKMSYKYPVIKQKLL